MTTNGVRVVIAAALILAPACVEPKSRTCASGYVCPPDMICDKEGQGCIYPEQLEVCEGQPEGSPCAIEGVAAPHVCVAGTCRRSLCGDGILDGRPEAGEVCDDGNEISGDGCRGDCLGTERCGDGLLDEDMGEQCDDGNENNEDGCTVHCRPPMCGDELVTGE